MPPKKKTRLSSRAASTLSTETPADTPSGPDDKVSPRKEDEAKQKENIADPWTDEQEISLFKGMIRWKPVGMHKHFRMLSISQHLRDQGHNSKQDPHIGIPGIWEKLSTLYNLKVLDEREDSIEATSDDSDPSKETFVPFKLPNRDFEDMMFARRLAPAGSSSPANTLPNEGRSNRRRPSVIDDSEGVSSATSVRLRKVEGRPTELRSSPASARGAKPTRGARGGRRSRLLEESTPADRSRSKVSVDGSGEGEEQEEEDEDDEEDEENEDSSEEDETPSSATRGVRGGRKPGRGGRWGRVKGRGRRAGRWK